VLTENGVLSALASPLAEATDYLLVASETISAAISNREDI
jgi:hypothetical protein